MKPLLPFLCMLSMLACAKPTGTITIINTTDKALEGTFAEEAFTIKPTDALIQHDVTVGEHEFMIGKEPITATVTEKLTTVINPHKQGCFVVADYRRQYGENPTGDVLIVERFKDKPQFTPSKPLIVAYGEKLPSKIREGSPARRLHAIDCSLLKDKKKIAQSLARLP